MYVEQLYTGCLAEAAYYIESNGEAAIVDPLRETAPYLELAARRGARLKYIFETHFHADFVSGHVDLARQTGATIVFGPTATPAYTAHVATDGEAFALGEVTLRVLHTPGHTLESASFLLLDAEEKPQAVFTGDTLFVGEVGRPDLAVPSDKTKEDLAEMLYDSLHNKLLALPDAVTVYPGHGAGSQCGKNIGQERYSTIGQQRAFNYALQPMTREAFVQMVTDIAAPPAYFPENARLNKGGYEPIDDVMTRNQRALTPAQVTDEVAGGTIVLDTRAPEAFVAGHLPNAVSVGLDGQFAVWVGTLLKIDQRLVVVADAGREEEAVLRLARVGFEHVAGYLAGGTAAWAQDGRELATVRSVDAEAFPALAAEPNVTVLDVRRPAETEVARVASAQTLPLAELPTRLDELNAETTYAVHCAGGYRSVIAASLLRRAGLANLVNVRGGFQAMEGVAGIDLTTGACPSERRRASLADNA